MTRLASCLAIMIGSALASAASAQAVRPGDAAKVERGRRVFEYWCAACHGSGAGKPGTATLAYKYKGAKPALLEERTDLSPQVTRYFVRTGVGVMPFFRKVEIGDDDLDALAIYLARRAGPPG